MMVAELKINNTTVGYIQIKRITDEILTSEKDEYEGFYVDIEKKIMKNITKIKHRRKDGMMVLLSKFLQKV